VNVLRGEPEPLHPRPSKSSAFDDAAAAVARDNELDKIFTSEETVAAESDEELPDVELFNRLLSLLFLLRRRKTRTSRGKRQLFFFTPTTTMLL
jgi:hypothetical protein